MKDAQLLAEALKELFGPDAIDKIRQHLSAQPMRAPGCSPYPPAFMTITFCLPSDAVAPLRAARAIRDWAEQMKGLGVQDLCVGIQKNKSGFHYELILEEMRGKTAPLFEIKGYEAPDGTCTAQARESQSPRSSSGCVQSG